MIDFTALPQPPAWTTNAACNEYPPDLWFAKRTATETTLARRICQTCPARAACLDYALQVDALPLASRDGIWAGYDGDERAKIRRKRARAA